jgi:hypothetical protein
MFPSSAGGGIYTSKHLHLIPRYNHPSKRYVRLATKKTINVQLCNLCGQKRVADQNDDNKKNNDNGERARGEFHLNPSYDKPRAEAGVRIG